MGGTACPEGSLDIPCTVGGQIVVSFAASLGGHGIEERMVGRFASGEGGLGRGRVNKGEQVGARERAREKGRTVQIGLVEVVAGAKGGRWVLRGSDIDIPPSCIGRA